MQIAIDILAVIQWVLVLELFAIAGVALVKLFPSSFAQYGFAFGRLISILTISYLGWIGTSLGLILFTQFNLRLLLFLLVMVSCLFVYLARNRVRILIKKYWRFFALHEVIFWLSFALFALIRWNNPDLWHPVMGGEKPMDFAFLNSILRTTTFPPLDPWFAGETIHYYYFGQVITATMIKLSGVVPSVGYNLMLAYLFAQVAVSTFSIVWSLTKSILASVAGILFLLISGNLAQIPLLYKYFAHEYLPINAWYWTATRVMPNSEINEFPFFSFLYADLHAHLLALPIALLIIALIISFVRKQRLSLLLFMGLLLGIIRITNIWDFPSYLLLVSLVVTMTTIKTGKWRVSSIIRAGVRVAIVSGVSWFAIIPFLTHYKTAALTVALYQGPFTKISDYFLIHGLFLFILVSFAIVSIKNKHHPRFIYLFAGFAIFLTLIPDTINIPLGLGRMNTVFKFYFQAWTFFALAAAAALPTILTRLRPYKIVLFSWLGMFLLIFMATLSYAPTATYAKIKDRMSLSTPPTLDGMRYMLDSIYYDKEQELTLKWDYEAIMWLRETVVGSKVIVEATTPTYRWGSRVSVYTGLPTVIGWDWHEIAHRFQSQEVGQRVADVEELYNTQETDLFLSLIHKYNIEYIYVGELERAYYEETGLKKFKELDGKIITKVYANQGVTIYKIIKNDND
ncbi:MAG: DUF2298 domain-containing protein [bacterium]|nr:DUF2298 domain-containing protein [bacterium]